MVITREPSQKFSFQLIKQEDDKFFSKLLSKEIPDSSFRVYYNGALSGSVPFFWESQPGTPKHRLNELTVPPLTPPPSYHLKSSNTTKGSSSSSKKLLSAKSNLLRILFLKARGKKKSSSSTNTPGDNDGRKSVIPSPTTTLEESKLRERRRFASRGSLSSSSDWSLNDGDQGFDGLPASILCFGAMRSVSVEQRGHGSIRRTRSCAS